MLAPPPSLEDFMGFDNAFQKTLGFEGGYSDDPNDPGNWTGGKVGIGILKGTKYGISAASYPDEDIKNLTLDRSKFLYHRDYWDPLSLDAVTVGPIAEEIFDTGVNMGIGQAGIVAQRAINFLEPGPDDLPLIVDGVIGPETLRYINKWCLKDPEALFKALNGFQFMRYSEIAHTTSKRFDWGWMKRIQQWREG